MSEGLTRRQLLQGMAAAALTKAPEIAEGSPEAIEVITSRFNNRLDEASRIFRKEGYPDSNSEMKALGIDEYTRVMRKSLEHIFGGKEIGPFGKLLDNMKVIAEGTKIRHGELAFNRGAAYIGQGEENAIFFVPFALGRIEDLHRWGLPIRELTWNQPIPPLIGTAAPDLIPPTQEQAEKELEEVVDSLGHSSVSDELFYSESSYPSTGLIFAVDPKKGVAQEVGIVLEAGTSDKDGNFVRKKDPSTHTSLRFLEELKARHFPGSISSEFFQTDYPSTRLREILFEDKGNATGMLVGVFSELNLVESHQGVDRLGRHARVVIPLLNDFTVREWDLRCNNPQVKEQAEKLLYPPKVKVE